MDLWLKAVAPSEKLRKWFNHDPDRWDDFLKRYRRELEGQTESLEELKRLVRKQTVTLLYAAKDEKHNNAVALRELLSS